MSSLDERARLNDELWAQIRPPAARFRVAISVAILVAVVGAMLLSQIGFFHPQIGASYEEASARGNRLTVVLTVYNRAQLPARVTGFRAAQPGARIVSTRFNGVFSPAPGNPAPDGARAAPFTLHAEHTETVTIVYLLDCAKLRLPLRLDIETRTLFGGQTSTATMDGSPTTPLRQVCASA